jgi:hypothetical protein
MDTPQRESIYLSLINECAKEVVKLRSNIGVIVSKSDKLENTKTEIPTRSILEENLNLLLNQIRSLNGDIVN